MPSNLYNPAHKSATPEYRDNYERIFARSAGESEAHGWVDKLIDKITYRRCWCSPGDCDCYPPKSIQQEVRDLKEWVGGQIEGALTQPLYGVGMPDRRAMDRT